MWDEKKIREINKPQIEAMTDTELSVIGRMIMEERARRIKDCMDIAFKHAPSPQGRGEGEVSEGQALGFRKAEDTKP